MSVFLIACIVLSYLFWIKCIYRHHPKTLKKSLKHLMTVGAGSETAVSDVRALIVTAHPDDECMFFAPTIIRLLQLKASVHLLCLSEGNYYNQGAQRKQELCDSCAVLGIPASQITIVQHKDLPDDPKAKWSIALVSSVIMKHLRTHSFNMVLTFDGKGVSGHANHISIYNAVSHLAFTGQVPQDCCLLSLVTVDLFRKYIFFLDLPLSWLLTSSLCCTISCQGYMQAKAAMLCHRSQLLWFRYLYVTFSRYMFTNTFRIIPHGPKDFKIY
ncbi:N-acetylglucosaminyl-phosphatidylinositol de-N-acetylase [Cynoglossus semilaevis]|uniref:N-acetylglucosaminylphosphatidylinositol deacetylase n=1 Tax=Cynoglossus semilaevis TaxID=244447 RepID=A0A3P8WEM5_CYNSE|nr:N-acetylglucosaminyl-phosphatidylinositol de-N-acetylase [Cynoglossus semilaevis]